MNVFRILWQWLKEMPTRHSPGFLQWLPAIGAGVNLLGKGLGWWGKDKPRPPDIGAERFQYDNQWIEDWKQRAEVSATEQANRFLNQAMQGINRLGGERGLVDTGWVGGKGGQAAELSAEQLASALADISGRAAGMEHEGRMRGMDIYATEYDRYLDQLYRDQEDWISSMIGLIPTS